MAAYATAADMMARFDVNILGDICSDTGVPVEPAELASNAKITAALADASGLIEAACLQGKRYTAAQLAALTGNSLGYLKRICCQIAYGLLWDNRSWIDDERRDRAMDRMKATLKDLRTGEIIFDVPLVPEAGLPSISQPTITEINRLNLVVDEARRGFYPARRLSE